VGRNKHSCRYVHFRREGGPHRRIEETFDDIEGGKRGGSSFTERGKKPCWWEGKGTIEEKKKRNDDESMGKKKKAIMTNPKTL